MSDYAIISTLSGRYEVYEACNDRSCEGVFHSLIATTDDRWQAQRIVRALITERTPKP
jgi:hypothetical protein